MFHILFEKFNNVYEKIFRTYGRFLANNYISMIVLSFLVNFLLSIGLSRMTMITNTDTLFMPSDSIASKHEQIVLKLYNSTKMSENFFLHQITDLGTWAEVNFRPVRSLRYSDENVLQEKYLKAIRKVNDYLIKNSFVLLNDSSKKIGYDYVCAKRSGACLTDGLDLLDANFYKKWLEESMKKKEQLLEEQKSLNSEEGASTTNEFRFYVKQTEKGASLTDLTYNLGKHFRINLFNESDNGKYPGFAKAVKLRYNLKSTYGNPEKLVLDWEKEFLKNIQSLLKSDTLSSQLFNSSEENEIFKSFKITYATSQSLETEMQNNIGFDAVLISGTFGLIMIFSTLLMSLRTDCITSPGYLLPMSGILSAVFGMTSAFGLLSFFNYPACNLIGVIPFLVFGIGIDDMFIIYSSFTHSYKTHLKKHHQLDDSHYVFTKLISKTLSHSAVSVTITSVTDFVAFIVGVTTSFKSVEIFCMYAGFSILFCYVYQLTFFAGFLCIHLKRIQKQKNSFLFCYKQSDLGCFCGTPQTEEDNNNKPTELEMVEQTAASSTNEIKAEPNECSDCPLPSKKCNSKLSKFVRFSEFQNLVKKFFKFVITTKKGNVLTLCIYLIYISLSVWSASRINEGINLGDLVSKDSYYNDYVNENNELTDLTPIVMFVIHEPIDYDSNVNKIKIRKFIKNALKLEGISKEFHLNWLDSFSGKINYKNDATDLLTTLKAFPPMANDVIIKQVARVNATGFENQIVSSRFYLQYSKLYFSSKDAVTMNYLRDLCQESGLPIIPYSLTFKFYEQFEETLPNILQAFIISIEAMYLISLIFIPDLVSAFCILFSMISIMIGMIGLMNVWNLSLSSITMIELIMSIGFCIDFSAHIVHAFLAGVGKGDRNKRAFKACMRVGLPIFNSAFSTIIGVCLLGASRTYIFLTFFKSILILMSLGLLNSLIFLPVLLSVIGPNWPRHMEVNEAKTKKVPDSTNLLPEKKTEQ